jgi:hypothetical protein
MASIDDSDGEMHYPDSGDEAIHYEANPFASQHKFNIQSTSNQHRQA